MKKYFKSIMSLFLAFTLIPAIPFNVASATSPHEISLGEVEVSVGEEKQLGTCLIKADSAYLSAEPATCFSVTSPGMSFGCGIQSDGNGKTFTPVYLSTPPQSLTFSIGNQGATSNTFNATLTIETGSNGCYDCTLSDGDKVSFGDCNADNNNGGNDNGGNGYVSDMGFPTSVKPGETGYFQHCKGLNVVNGNYEVMSDNDATDFTIFVEENGQLTEESSSVDGKAIIDLVPREYKSVAFGVKNKAQNSDTFTAFLTDFSGQKKTCVSTSGASRILAPIAALLGGLLFLF